MYILVHQIHYLNINQLYNRNAQISYVTKKLPGAFFFLDIQTESNVVFPLCFLLFVGWRWIFLTFLTRSCCLWTLLSILTAAAIERPHILWEPYKNPKQRGRKMEGMSPFAQHSFIHPVSDVYCENASYCVCCFSTSKDVNQSLQYLYIYNLKIMIFQNHLSVWVCFFLSCRVRSVFKTVLKGL